MQLRHGDPGESPWPLVIVRNCCSVGPACGRQSTWPIGRKGVQMANWYGTSRSNYFRVRDKDAFLKWAKGAGLACSKTKRVQTCSPFMAAALTMVLGRAMT